jgi:hypothetical protein
MCAVKKTARDFGVFFGITAGIFLFGGLLVSWVNFCVEHKWGPFIGLIPMYPICAFLCFMVIKAEYNHNVMLCECAAEREKQYAEREKKANKKKRSKR